MFCLFLLVMKITLIGCGWLGLPLAKRLIANGHSVYGSTTHPEKLSELEEVGIHSFLYSEKSNVLLKAEVKEVDLLIIDFPPSKSTNYPLQIQLLLEQFPSATKVIFTSSIGVYQDVDQLTDENSPVITDHPVYLAEEVIRNTRKDFAILRLGGLIGMERHPVKYMSGKTVKDANAYTNLVHQDDVLASIEWIIQKDTWNKTYNICSEKHPTKVSYYSDSAKKMNLPLPLFELSDKKGKFINGNRIVEELDFQYTSPI